MKHNPIIDGSIILDAEVELTRENVAYKKRLRVIKAKVRDEEKQEEIEMEFISNLLEQPAILIAEIYKHRRKIETFFRRIKQNLNIKTFF
jgi:IS4 transposase